MDIFGELLYLLTSRKNQIVVLSKFKIGMLTREIVNVAGKGLTAGDIAQAMAGPAMAIALLTTFYGSLIANMIATPIATKMKIRSIEEQHLREIMLAGIMAIQSGDNPRIVEQKLNAYLPPSQRKSQFD